VNLLYIASRTSAGPYARRQHQKGNSITTDRQTHRQTQNLQCCTVLYASVNQFWHLFDSLQNSVPNTLFSLESIHSTVSHLVSMYKACGPGIFIEYLWNIYHQSPTQQATLAKFLSVRCNHIPTHRQR
jgi:hypothetical protein